MTAPARRQVLPLAGAVGVAGGLNLATLTALARAATAARPGRDFVLADADLIDSDLAVTTDYRNVLAELLQKHRGARSLSTVFPDLTPDAIGAFRART